MHKTNTAQFLLLYLWLSIISLQAEDIMTALPHTGGSRAFAMGGSYIAYNKGINALEDI